ncbi:MAG: LysE family translocator [Waterburya sp.]
MMSTYIAFAAAVFTLIASPGPIIALVISESRSGCFINTLIGAIISSQILLITTLLIIYFSLDTNSTMLNFLQIFGGGYLVWLGINTLRTGIYKFKNQKVSKNKLFWKALKVGLSNPKDILFLLAFLPGFITTSEPFLNQSLTLIAIWGVIDMFVLNLYSYLSIKILTHHLGQRLLTYIPGFIIIGFGFFSILEGINGT